MESVFESLTVLVYMNTRRTLDYTCFSLDINDVDDVFWHRWYEALPFKGTQQWLITQTDSLLHNTGTAMENTHH